ncbi:MAG: hypothetical protein ACM37W_25685 [Actinomycetota bacterium]
MIPQMSQLYQTREYTMTPKAMQKLNPSLSQDLRQRLYQRHWLEWAEYASLAGSALGSLAVALSGQAFYGVAPLTLAVSLNVANRYRFEQQVRLSQDADIAEVQRSVEKMERTAVTVIVKLRQQLSTDLELIHQQLAAIPRLEGFDAIDIEEQLLSLGQSVAALQEIVANVVLEVRQQVNEQLQQALAVPGSVDLDPLSQAIAQLQSTTKRLEESALTQADWEMVNTRFLTLQEAIATLQNDLQVLGHERQPNIEEMQAQIDQLEQQYREVVNPNLKRLISVVKQLQPPEVRFPAPPPRPEHRRETH